MDKCKVSYTAKQTQQIQETSKHALNYGISGGGTELPDRVKWKSNLNTQREQKASILLAVQSVCV